MRRSRRVPARCTAALLAAMLAGCASTALDAYQGDYGAQAEMYVKNATLQPDGRLTDPIRAEYWLQQMVQQRADYYGLYAAALMDGRFGHIDEAQALTEAQAAPSSGNPTAQDILDSVAKLRDAAAKDFPAWQALYAETRPLCPDRYPQHGSELDATLAMARHGARYDLLPDAIEPGMANVHAYLLLAETCPFSLVEQLDDPKVYAAYADWSSRSIVSNAKQGAAARALMAERFPAAGVVAPSSAAESIAAVREDVLLHYLPVFTPHDPGAKTQPTAECYEALLPVHDALDGKDYADLVALAEKAATDACHADYGRAMADRYAALGLSLEGKEIEGIARDLALLKTDTYDAPLEKETLANMFEAMNRQGSWATLDDLVTTLKTRYPAIKPLKL